MSSPCEDLQECRQNETGVKNPANKRADAHATPTLRNHWLTRRAFPVIGNTTEIGEGRVGDNGAELGLGAQAFQHQRGAHRLTEPIDAACTFTVEPGNPTVNVAAFAQAVGCDGATRLAV